MRAITSLLLSIMFLLTGCGNADTPLDSAIALRNRIEESNGCSFLATVTADYGENAYVFSMECQTDKEGNLTFCVTEPATIAGITGKITTAGGSLTFDDQVLAFQTMADGLVSPVTGPWLLIKTLKSGYLKGCARLDDGYEISADDSYADEALHLQIITKADLPQSAEIFWDGRRVLTVSVENFMYL